MPTYNYVNQSKKTGPGGHVYICNVNLFWFFPTSPPPFANRNHRRLSHPSLSKGVQNFHLQFQKERKKKGKKEKNVSYRVVSCR